MLDYREILDKVNENINNLHIKDLQDLNKLSSFLYITKEPLVISKENSIEFYTYCAIQNVSICVDNCRDNLINDKMTLSESEEQIKKQWNDDYAKF